MRPRHRAAEYGDIEPVGGSYYRLASMRPRHRAAEYDGFRLPAYLELRFASMRPRHRAAEYRGHTRLGSIYIHGFNEAAA